MKKVYAFVILLLFARVSFGNIYYVINNQVSGTGSLNQAIFNANNHPGRDSVYFNIPFSGIADRTITINSLFLLPDITGPLTIDATTQTAGNPIGLSSAKIQLTSSDLVSAALVLASDSCEIYGLYINHFVDGIQVLAGDFKIGAVNFGNVINDCTDACVTISEVIQGSILASFIGVDTSGNIGTSPLANGIYAENSKKITIGGKQSGARNFISGNNVGIKLSNCKYMDIQGNYIGTDVTGSAAVPNYTGILISTSSNNIAIGGDSTKESNLISGNLQRAIDVEMYSSTVQGNYIGTDATHTFAIGNGDYGIYLRDLSHDNVIGGLETATAGNIIAYNGKEAIYFQNAGVKNISMRGNHMYCNGQLGGDGGIVLNGGNQDIPVPFLVLVSSDVITGTSFAGLEIDLYTADSCTTCEGNNYLATAFPDNTGVFVFNDIPIYGKVTVTANDSFGNSSSFAICQDSTTATCVNSAFTISDFDVCVATPLQFTDQSITIPGSSIVSWSWDFGDGQTSAQPNPTHTYSTPGTYTVNLEVANSQSCFDTSSQVVVILDGVTAAISLPVDGCEGKPVFFDDQSVSQGTSFIVSWNWELGDGSTSFFSDFDHTYTAVGDYTVTLNVINSNGCISSDSTIIHIHKSPTADFSVTTVDCSPDPVPFTDLSTPGSGASIASWQWDFGNGATSTDQNPIYQYTTTGTYTVQLIVTNNFGCSDTATQDVEILLAPDAQFTYSIDGLTVNFQNTSASSTDFGLAWSFGDGNTTSLINPSHTYSTTGAYEVCLIVIDFTCDLNDTLCQTILITGIDDVISALNNLITVSPNPATDVLTIENIPSTEKIKSLELMDIIGKKTSLLSPQNVSPNSLSVPLPSLPQGTYLLKIETPEGIVMKKILISN